jgi:ribosomal protein S18 acetylase RimI-like enzyme
MDEDFWLDDSEGGYVHTFAIRPWVHGQRIGVAMMEWAKQHVRARGKQFLRLDCWGGNVALRKYYAGLGFTFVRLANEEDWVVAIFQMAV